MTSKAINSGAINAVSFPGSESGATLIELIGDVEVLGSISMTYLRVGAMGSTTASAATGRPTPRTIALLGATASGQASCSASALRKAFVGTASAAASCVTSSTVSARYGIKAVTQARSSSTTVDTFRKSLSLASTMARAVTACNSVKRCRFSAGSLAAASTSAGALTKVPMSATARWPVTASASIIIEIGVSASSTSTATGSIGTLLHVNRYAAAIASAAGSPLQSKMAFGASATANAVAYTSLPATSIRALRAAYGLAIADQSVNAMRRVHLSASTSANVKSYCLARDFASSVRAPEERQMVVPENDRTMKVEPA